MLLIFGGQQQIFNIFGDKMKTINCISLMYLGCCLVSNKMPVTSFLKQGLNADLCV